MPDVAAAAQAYAAPARANARQLLVIHDDQQLEDTDFAAVSQ